MPGATRVPLAGNANGRVFKIDAGMESATAAQCNEANSNNKLAQSTNHALGQGCAPAPC